MDTDGRIELRLGRAAIKRNRKALDDLPGVGTDHMTAKHAVGFSIDDQLHHRPFVAAGQSVLERFE